MTDAEAEIPILWPPDVKNWFIRNDPDDRLDGHDLSKLSQLVMDKEALHAAVYGITKSRTQLSNWQNWSEYLF